MITCPPDSVPAAVPAGAPVRDGDGWVLNGQKTFITNGEMADLVIV
ncbi:acyl-CoA dehydrogenase, partial [Micromonospora purpureochromogenes]